MKQQKSRYITNKHQETLKISYLKIRHPILNQGLDCIRLNMRETKKKERQLKIEN